MEKSHRQNKASFDPFTTKNELIVKAELGKGKPVTHDLPSKSHTYGRTMP
jgi:hypothetical protein